MGPDSPARIWNVPHRKNLNFSGRETLLDSLRASLTSNQATALSAVSGMGGVGKTQLALEYAYRYASEYQAVLWVPSEEPAALASAFAGLATVLGLPEQAEAEQRIAIEAVQRWLAVNTDWLLVFDNAPGPRKLEEYLPNRDTGNVIITSRYPNWGGVANSLFVEKFDREESIEFLLKRTGQTDSDAANELADELGDLPLALEQAGAYMERTGGSLSDYKGLYSDRFEELWQQDAPPPSYDQTIATTWSMSIQQLPQVAADLLNLCAFLGPDGIPKDLISQGAAHLPEPLAGAVSDALTLGEAVAALRSYSLIELGSDSWSVHRLVQGVVRGRLDNEDRNTWAEAAADTMSGAFPYDSDEVEYWPTCSRLLPHAMAAAGHAEGLGIAPGATGYILNQVALYLKQRAQFLEAKSALERAVEIDEMDLGPAHPRVAIRLNNLGNVLSALGDFGGAREKIQRALAIHEEAYGPDHTDVAIGSSNLGGVLRKLGDLEGAREHIQRALVIASERLGEEHPTTVRYRRNLESLSL